jgi:type 1 glutamine amidotransferase
MLSRRNALVMLACLIVPGVTGVPSFANAADKPRILFVTQSKGFVHSSVNRKMETRAPAEIALTQLGETTGAFTVDCTQDCAADFTKENLQNYDIVAFYTTGDLPIAEEDMNYFLKEWLTQEGHGVLGFHSAMDTYKEYMPYVDMIGGAFISHPWNSGTNVVLTNHEPDNRLVQSFGPEFRLKEEIYMYKHWQPEKVRVLLSLDYAKSPVGSPVDVSYGYHVPVCWIKEYGKGRVYCNNLGHNESTWTNPAFQKSIVEAVKWINREFDVDASPNPEVSAAQEEKARADAAAGNFNIKGKK